jgi:peptidyl-prolyl cis-trans isomerase A (cyclophilin A)
MSFSTGFAQSSKWLKHTTSAVCLGGSLLLSQFSSATTVQFQTVMGDFEVNLFDKTTPKTVANFLAYIKADAYKNTIVHRAVPGFVVQGGGYSYQGKLPLVAITQNPKVENEPVYSNLRGTIAMAKLGSDANSATNQWFFNLANNASNLDKQNGGFTVFGQVMGNGMAIVDAMAALNRFTFGGLENFPLRNYTAEDNKNNVAITDSHFVMIQNIVVLQTDADTAANLNPTKNTLINEKDKDDNGSGSIGLISLLGLGLLALGRKRLLNRK